MDELYNMLFRWGHILVGVTWIGLLYYFNFVQTEYFKEAEEESRKDAVAKLVPRALWWFRWAALFTFLTGVALLYFITMRLNLDIIFGAIMGTLMMLNVWGIIWPNQKIVIGLKDGDATVAGPKAALASRTNTLFSIPMLYFMVSSAHYPHGGYLLAGNMSMESFYVGLLIILAIEANAIWGKMVTIISSVRDVIVSGFVLAIALSSVAYYL
tara:strand:+ start:853 stop:1488 length:636 start_codon:yes stop_codon:yes gene_type:complete